MTLHMARCPVALDDGTRCPNDVIAYGWRRCKGHGRTSLGLNVTPAQRNLLEHLAYKTTAPPMKPGHRERSLRALVNKRLVHVTENGIQTTEWGFDIARGLRR